MTEVLLHNFEYIMKVRERIVFGLFAVISVLFVGYVCLMEKTVANSVSFRATQNLAAKEDQTVNALSSRYVALQSGVSLSAALAMGLQPASVSAFVTVPAESPALSFNGF